MRGGHEGGKEVREGRRVRRELEEGGERNAIVCSSA